MVTKSKSREIDRKYERRSRSRDDEIDPRYDRQMKNMKKDEGCCSLPKFIVFFVFLGVSLGLIFGLVDIEEIESFFTGGGGAEDSGVQNDNGGNEEPTPYQFMQCPTNGECCNGLQSNCDMKINEIMYATVHNANHDDLFIANNEAPLEDALVAGYRGLMIDVCKCGEGASAQITFCHGVCGVGSRDPSVVFENINSFLTQNPTEIVVINFEISVGNPTPDEIWQFFKVNTPLRRKTYIHNGWWPTLRQALGNGKQLVVFEHNHNQDCTNGGPGCATRVLSFFDYAVETPWDFSDVAALENVDASCAEDRGKNGSKEFYSVNNFVTATLGPSKSSANTINEKSFLEARLKDCKKKTGHDINFLNIDFWQRGDLLEVTQEENKNRARRRRRGRLLGWFLG